jgi:hypothetical protein
VRLSGCAWACAASNGVAVQVRVMCPARTCHRAPRPLTGVLQWRSGARCVCQRGGAVGRQLSTAVPHTRS